MKISKNDSPFIDSSQRRSSDRMLAPPEAFENAPANAEDIAEIKPTRDRAYFLTGCTEQKEGSETEKEGNRGIEKKFGTHNAVDLPTQQDWECFLNRLTREEQEKIAKD